MTFSLPLNAAATGNELSDPTFCVSRPEGGRAEQEADNENCDGNVPAKTL